MLRIRFHAHRDSKLTLVFLPTQQSFGQVYLLKASFGFPFYQSSQINQNTITLGSLILHARYKKSKKDNNQDFSQLLPILISLFQP